MMPTWPTMYLSSLSTTCFGVSADKSSSCSSTPDVSAATSSSVCSEHMHNPLLRSLPCLTWGQPHLMHPADPGSLLLVGSPVLALQSAALPQSAAICCWSGPTTPVRLPEPLEGLWRKPALVMVRDQAGLETAGRAECRSPGLQAASSCRTSA